MFIIYLIAKDAQKFIRATSIVINYIIFYT